MTRSPFDFISGNSCGGEGSQQSSQSYPYWLPLNPCGGDGPHQSSQSYPFCIPPNIFDGDGQSSQSYPFWMPPNPCSEEGSMQIGFSTLSWTTDNGMITFTWVIPCLGTYSWQSCGSSTCATPKTYFGEFDLIGDARVSWEVEPDKKEAKVTYLIGDKDEFSKTLNHEVLSYPFPDDIRGETGTYKKVSKKPILTTSVDWNCRELILVGSLGFTATSAKKSEQQIVSGNDRQLQRWK